MAAGLSLYGARRTPRWVSPVSRRWRVMILSAAAVRRTGAGADEFLPNANLYSNGLRRERRRSNALKAEILCALHQSFTSLDGSSTFR